MRKMKCMFLLILLALLSGAFVACSDDDDSSESKMYTVTLYTAFGENPVTAKVESGKTLGANMTPSKDGYDFKGWFSVDGTDYTKKAIESDVTLFAYFIKTTTEGSGTATVTTTTNEVGADSYESEKKVAVTTNADGTTVTVTTENTSKTNADGSTTETKSTTTENFDGTNTITTSEKTVTTKDADGNTTSKVETTVAADGTTTTTTTDASGKTTTETTGGSGEKLEVSLDNAGYPTFEIPIPQGTEKISVYRKKNDEDEYTKILYVYAKVFEIDAYEFTDLYVAKNASYSYYYQIAGWTDEGFEKTSGKSDFVPITNGKLGELEVSVSGGEVNYNEKTGVLTLTTVPTVTSGFSCDLYVDSYIPYSICSGSTYYKTNGDTINLYTHHKGNTLTPYWYVYLREWDSEHHYTGYWYPSEFYGADYGLPESITVPTEISTDTDEADTTLANTSYKSTELKMNGSAAPSGVSETVSFASDGKNCTLTGYYNSTGTYTVSGTSVTVNYTSGDIIGTMTGTLSDSNATLTAQGTVTVSGKSVLMYGVFAKQGGGSEERLKVSLNNTGYPTFEIPIPQDSDIYIETLSISVYRKKSGDATYSKILDVDQNRKDSFETNPSYEFTDLYVAKSASYSYYYQINGKNENGNFTKTSGKSDFVSITNGKFGELVASVSGGEVSFNAKTGILTLSTLPTVPSDFSYMLKMKNLDYGYLIRESGKYYQTKGDTIDLFKSNKGKTLIPYWYVYRYESDDYLREYWYPVVSEFYGTDYGLPESITVPTEISTDTDEADTTLANTSYKSTELKMNGSAAPSGVSETVSFASDGKNCTLTGYYNSTGTYTVSGTSVTVNYTSGDILGTMTGTLTNSNATLTAQGTVTVSGKSVLMYGAFAK